MELCSDTKIQRPLRVATLANGEPGRASIFCKPALVTRGAVTADCTVQEGAGAAVLEVTEGLVGEQAERFQQRSRLTSKEESSIRFSERRKCAWCCAMDGILILMFFNLPLSMYYEKQELY